MVIFTIWDEQLAKINSMPLCFRFDSVDRYINDNLATITFYDSDEVKVGKKLVCMQLRLTAQHHMLQ